MTKRKFITRTEVNSLLDATKQGRYPNRDYCLLLMSFLHGLRVSELTHITMADIDLVQKVIFIRRLKGGLSNDVVVGTGTCDINDNQIIIVDFETVNASGISTVGSASRFQRNAEITYSCEDNNLTAPIKMIISGETSTFSSDALLVRTGDIGSQGPIMPGLGVEIYHQGQRVSPMNGHFDSKIENGHGRDTLMFTLVKKPNLSPNELIEGQFSSAATIIMSTP